MPDLIRQIEISKWVDHANGDKVKHLQRQATEIILHAIAMEPSLSKWLYLKGGILMGLVYDSPRQTSDVDFSATDPVNPNENTANIFREHLDSTLPRAAAKLGYVDIAIQVQTVKKLPHNTFLNARFPALKIKVAYAERNSHQENMLNEGNASNTISVDISFNEKIVTWQILEIADGLSLRAYSQSDLIAEKFRALLQQVIRKRNRRQDVYDLHILIEKRESDNNAAATLILNTLIEKCKSRDIEPYSILIDDKEIESHSRAEWNSMKLETGELPDFDSCYGCIATFYRQLPWRALD